MKLSKSTLVIFSLDLIFFVLAASFYRFMPARMASHWNAAGQADGTISRLWGLFLIPLLAGGLSALFLAIPRIDPLKDNIKKFEWYYRGFIIVFLAYFLYVYLLTLLWNVNVRFNFSTALIPAVGVLIFLLGVLIGKAKRNFFIGIRTPWTLSSDQVWDRTHRLGAILFKITGVVIVLLSLVPVIAADAMVVLLVVITVWLVVYSYVIYRRLEHPSRPGTG